MRPSRERFLRFLVFFAVHTAAQALGARAALADVAEPVAPGPHRLIAATGLADSVQAGDEGDNDARGLAVFSRLGYAYRLLRWLEVGGEFDTWFATSSIDALIPSVCVRPFVPIGNSVEVGLSATLGLSIWPQTYSTRAFIGPGYSLAVDGRVWLAPAVGVSLSAEGAAVSGKDSGYQYLPPPNVGRPTDSFLAGGFSLGLVARL